MSARPDRTWATMARVYLTLTSTAPNATDLGFLLHKHPDRAQTFTVPFGQAHVFYPEASERRCTAALLVEVDPVALVQGQRFRGDGYALGQYVNDRPYAASSLLSVALVQVFRTAMSGRCAHRPDLEGLPLPLELTLPSIRSRGGSELVHRLFEPLGWTVRAETVPLDPAFTDWGDSRYVTTTLTGTLTPAQALTAVYVLLPVLDGAKHYWVSTDEVDKLLRAGEGWLDQHPEKELIMARYLAYSTSLITSAVERLRAGGDQPETADPEIRTDPQPAEVDEPAPPTPLNRLRQQAVLDHLAELGAHRVVDLGCGSGALLRLLLADSRFTEIIGTDVSQRELDIAARRLRIDELHDRQRERIQLLQSSVTYRDDRLSGFDAVIMMEVIEHLDLDRLPALESSVFGWARPRHVIVTTPNAEFNLTYPTFEAGAFRHADHRFEWTRSEFAAWTDRVAMAHGYTVVRSGVGAVDPTHGSPTQLAVFSQGVDQ